MSLRVVWLTLLLFAALAWGVFSCDSKPSLNAPLTTPKAVRPEKPKPSALTFNRVYNVYRPGAAGYEVERREVARDYWNRRVRWTAPLGKVERKDADTVVAEFVHIRQGGKTLASANVAFHGKAAKEVFEHGTGEILEYEAEFKDLDVEDEAVTFRLDDGEILGKRDTY